MSSRLIVNSVIPTIKVACVCFSIHEHRFHIYSRAVHKINMFISSWQKVRRTIKLTITACASHYRRHQLAARINDKNNNRISAHLSLNRLVIQFRCGSIVCFAYDYRRRLQLITRNRRASWQLRIDFSCCESCFQTC